MKKSKLAKVLSVLLSVFLLVGLLAACGSSDSSSQASQPSSGSESTSQPDSSTGSEDGVWTGEVSKVVMTYLTAGTVPTDMELVVAAINEITIPAIGVEVEYKPISVFEAISQFTTWIASGERMDLMMVAFANIGNYINQDMIDPLDDLIAANAPTIAALSEEFPIYGAATKDGSVYGVAPVSANFGTRGCYQIDKEMLEAAGLADQYKDQDEITLDELGEIFAAVKEANPDIYPCGVGPMQTGANFTAIYEPLGDTAASGVLVGTSSTEVVNKYETEEYQDYLRHMREWYLAGYIPRDAATSDMILTEMYQSGITAGYFGEGRQTMKGVAAQMGREFVQLHLTDPYGLAASAAAAYWTIPVTAEEPEAAMRFLDMMYSSKEVLNLIQWGIEGEHYVFKDEAIGFIGQPEGVTTQTNGYYVPMGLYGDQRMLYFDNEGANPEVEKELNEAALNNISVGMGFAYDPSAMTAQIVAIQGVITEYEAALETGTADLDTTYPEFIQKLKANGIDDVIADKQAQFDAWLAQQ